MFKQALAAFIAVLGLNTAAAAQAARAQTEGPTCAPPGLIPNSRPCLTALTVSLPVANAITLAPEACAGSRKEEKSDVLIGARTLPNTLPPAALTNWDVSRSSA